MAWTVKEIVNCRGRKSFIAGIGASCFGKIDAVKLDLLALNVGMANGVVIRYLLTKIPNMPESILVLLQCGILAVLLLKHIKQHRGGIFFFQGCKIIAGIGKVCIDIQSGSQCQQVVQRLAFLRNEINRGWCGVLMVKEQIVTIQKQIVFPGHSREVGSGHTYHKQMLADGCHCTGDAGNK